MSVQPIFLSDNYPDGMTKQAFKDECDINKILARAAQGDSIAHLAKYEAVYGDFTDIGDLLDAQLRLEKGRQIFAELPAEIRREFNQDVGAFFEFVNDPANRARLPEVLPQLALPANQLPSMRRTMENMLDQVEPKSPPETPAA